MKMSQGEVKGRFAEPYHPEQFQNHEEVIVFTREEFNRTYRALQEHINHIEKIYFKFETGENWKLLGYWPEIMGKTHLLDVNMDSLFKKELQQCYLDVYLNNIIGDSEKKVVPSRRKVSVKL